MVRPPRFHTKRRHTPLWKRALPVLTIFAAIGAAAYFNGAPSLGTNWTSNWANNWGDNWDQVDTRFSLCAKRDSNACVIDGDTILLGRGETARKIRLSGYNAPELAGECAAENELAIKSRDALLGWLNAGPFLISGGTEPPYDKYGRELREMKRGKEWLSETLIAASLAQQSGWGFTRGGWCD